MPDPITSHKAQALTAQAKQSGLAALLKSGPQTGMVISVQVGKAQVMLQNRAVTVDSPPPGTQPGQSVILRESGGRILIEPNPQTVPSTSAKTPEAPKGTLQQTLAKMGFSNPSVEVIAKALLGAGAPLDPTVLRELAKALPQVLQAQFPALQFLLSRGLPITPAVLSLVAGLFSQKYQPGKSLDRAVTRLDDLLHELAERGDKTPPELMQRLGAIRQRLEQNILPLRDLMQPRGKEEIRRLIEQALSSPESHLLSDLNRGQAQIGKDLMELRALLLELRSQNMESWGESLDTLLQEINTLHEALSTQALENLPPQGDAAPVFFVQIPYREGEETRKLEIRYRPRQGQDGAGTLDMRLEMSQLGPLWLSLLWTRPQLSLSLAVQTPEAQSRLQAQVDDLTNALNSKGFSVAAINIRIDEIPETLRPEPTSPLIRPLDLHA